MELWYNVKDRKIADREAARKHKVEQSEATRKHEADMRAKEQESAPFNEVNMNLRTI
jgi:hypothetical protein